MPPLPAVPPNVLPSTKLGQFSIGIFGYLLTRTTPTFAKRPQTKAQSPDSDAKMPAYLLIACCLTQGCADVAPWERGNLAKPEMAITPNPSQNRFRDHVFTSKEASQGGHGGNGGGCGCN